MSVQTLIHALDERTIARQVGNEHDQARLSYTLSSNTVRDFDEFESQIVDYYEYHFSKCVSHGGRLSHAEAAGRAKEIIERDYRRKKGNIVSAFHNGRDGTVGGMREILDIIAEGLKAECVERYVRDVFSRHIDPSSWPEKVEFMRAFLDQCGTYLSPSIDCSAPERYAQDHIELIRVYVDALRQTSSVFRRL